MSQPTGAYSISGIFGSVGVCCARLPRICPRIGGGTGGQQKIHHRNVAFVSLGAFRGSIGRGTRRWDPDAKGAWMQSTDQFVGTYGNLWDLSWNLSVGTDFKAHHKDSDITQQFLSHTSWDQVIYQKTGPRSRHIIWCKILCFVASRHRRCHHWNCSRNGAKKQAIEIRNINENRQFKMQFNNDVDRMNVKGWQGNLVVVWTHPCQASGARDVWRGAKDCWKIWSYK